MNLEKSNSSPKKTTDKDQSNTKHGKLNLDGITLSKHETDAKQDKHEINSPQHPTHVVNLLWDGMYREQHKKREYVPAALPVNQSSLTPKHNSPNTRMVKRELKPKVFFKVYPTRSFKKLIPLAEERKNFDVKHEKDVVYTKNKRNNKVSNARNNTFITEDNHKISSDAYQVFNTNRKTYISNELPNVKLFPCTHTESTMVPYKMTTLSMRRDCTKFRKKWL